LRLWLRHQLSCLFVVPSSADGPPPLLAFGELGDWEPTDVDLLDLARCRGSCTVLLAAIGRMDSELADTQEAFEDRVGETKGTSFPTFDDVRSQTCMPP